MIKNTTKKTILMQQSAVMRSHFEKSTGLMFHDRVSKGLVFPFGKPRKIILHMMFVFCPIDVLFLDKNNKIVEIKESLQPFSFYSSKHNASTFIELPDGKIKATKTKV